MPGDEGVREEETDVAKNDAACADGANVGRAEQPFEEAADAPRDDGHFSQRLSSVQGDERAAEQERGGIGDEVAEIAVQQRGEGDPDEAAHGSRDDAEWIERVTQEDCVDDFQEPKDRDAAEEHRERSAHGEPAGRGGLFFVGAVHLGGEWRERRKSSMAEREMV